MNEITLQTLFENYLIEQKIPYEREFLAHHHTIDFKINVGGRVCGVEVKSSNGDVFNCLGQLFVAKKTFSHMYLLAPEDFLEKTRDFLEELGVGAISFKEGMFVFLKEPKQPKHYFNQPGPQERLRLQKPKIKNLMIMDRDYSILVNFKNKVFSCLDVMGLLKISRADAYTRIKRLLKVGLVEEMNNFNPKTYRVKKTADRGVKFRL